MLLTRNIDKNLNFSSISPSRLLISLTTMFNIQHFFISSPLESTGTVVDVCQRDKRRKEMQRKKREQQSRVFQVEMCTSVMIVTRLGEGFFSVLRSSPALEVGYLVLHSDSNERFRVSCTILFPSNINAHQTSVETCNRRGLLSIKYNLIKNHEWIFMNIFFSPFCDDEYLVNNASCTHVRVWRDLKVILDF